MQKRLIIIQDQEALMGHIENPDHMADGELLTCLLDTIMNISIQMVKLHVCSDPNCRAQSLAYRVVEVIGNNFKDYQDNPRDHKTIKE